MDTAPQQVFEELRAARRRLLEEHERTAAVYEKWDETPWDYGVDGRASRRFHPEGLARREELLPLCKYGTDDEFLTQAQRTSNGPPC